MNYDSTQDLFIKLKAHIKQLPEGYVVFRRMRSQRALCYYHGKCRIHIDPRMEIIELFIHEMLHDMDSFLSEKQVVDHTKRLLKLVGHEDAIFFLSQILRLAK